MDQLKRHESMRGFFAYELYHLMKKDKNIVLLVGDLGYKMFDFIKRDFTWDDNQFFNCGASEQAMMGIAVGLAQAGKIPVVYSITTFLLLRPFETIRNYIYHENANVKLVGGGRKKDYKHDGYSHHIFEEGHIFNMFNNIKTYYPVDKFDVNTDYVRNFIYDKSPGFLSLTR